MDERQTPGWKYNHWEMRGVPVRRTVCVWGGGIGWVGGEGLCSDTAKRYRKLCVLSIDFSSGGVGF